MKQFKVAFFNAFLIVAAAGCSRPTAPDEVAKTRAARFYSETSESILSEPLPKFSTKTQERVYPNPYLRFETGGHSPTPLPTGLLATAQKKGTPEFQAAYCKEVLGKHFPKVECSRLFESTWSSSEANDQPEDLLRTWTEKVVRDLDILPTEGKTSLSLWSDDYWKIRFGITSYRYSTGKYFANYKEAIGAYSQPLEWTELLKQPDPALQSPAILAWSPSEKYDLATGDERFSLTLQQKKAGESVLGEDGDVESWMGICHGWAAAAIVVPAPEQPVTVTGAKGVPFTWYPHDIRALASLAWANGRAANGFVGGRCNTKKPETYPNGRLKDPACFDNNPATFHVALGNQIGIQKSSFVMDAAFDYEVWNQPIAAYHFTYFNPLDPQKTSDHWKDVMVPYDDAFKAKDRFQKPLTRGKRSETGEVYDDTAVKGVVGVTAKVTYLTEVRPVHAPAARESEQVDVYYEYDLELSSGETGLVPTGGEWHTNFHPDFLWAPEKGAVASTYYDQTAISFTGKEAPTADVAALAEKASGRGYPLCKVLSTLVNASTKSEVKYLCP